MNIAADLTLAGALAAVWLTAGLLADGLPAARTAAELCRRAGLLGTLIGGGAALFVAVPVVSALLPGTSSAPQAVLLAAVPALVVLTTGLRRLTQVRRAAEMFATAPRAPVPYALRAAAAHPLVAAPLQVTGLSALVGLPIAAGVVEVPGTNVVAVAAAAFAVAVVGLGVRHALRHSRYNVQVVVPLTRSRVG